MKTIGLLGGMSWESTTTYYQLINQGIQQRLGGLHSAQLCLYSVDFAHIEKLQNQGDWQASGELLADYALNIQSAGADCLLLCTNTMHKIAPQIEAVLSIPFIHIADATADQLISNNMSTVGLLGTCFTMQEDFYKQRLQLRGITTLVPSVDRQLVIHRIIYDELCLGKILPASRSPFVEAINELHANGAQAIILGCTEIPLLVQQEHSNLPLFDTTKIHAQKAVDFALTKV